ncbi:S8 family serine peptidase [Nesterenkonia sp. F]|uniref:S8 family serine peptidase n=1 Tax=Nesterenkonia sp. F TaxID=795955 RepID=UPI000255D57C|nr:S8 family serine peptidase [Nesterenkonia sp. F]
MDAAPTAPGPTSTAETGRWLVVVDTDDVDVRHREVPEMLDAEGLSVVGYYPRLGVAVVERDDDRLEGLRLRCHERRRPLTLLPERTYQALDRPVDGTAAAGADSPTNPADPDEPAEPAEPPFADTAEHTWGVQAVRAVASGATGAGVKVAVLDTGFAADHPDFRDRRVTAESFIDDEGPEDGHGHGTHCIGTACGPRAPGTVRGYGVAPEAEILAGKVLGADGGGSDASILAGLDWALQHECAVISMSLGSDVREVHPPYVAAGRRALEQGSLIVAAAGNNASRSAGDPGFVGAPANSPSVMAVGAIDAELRIADFSARTLPRRGGQVDVAAPGVEIFSSWAGEQQHRTISGTSMATPHVAGVAALLAESTGLRGRALWATIVQEAVRLDLPSIDVGSGLTVVPPLERPAEGPAEEPTGEPTA